MNLLSITKLKLDVGGEEVKHIIRQNFVEISCRNRLSHKMSQVVLWLILGFSVASSLLKVHLNIFSLLTSFRSKYFYGLLDSTKQLLILAQQQRNNRYCSSFHCHNHLLPIFAGND